MDYEPVTALQQACERFPLKQCYRASGRVYPTRQVTINTVPRIFMPINAPVQIQIPDRQQIASPKLHVGDALLMPAHLWNHSSGGKSFLVLFFAQNHCRLLVWHRDKRIPSQSQLIDHAPLVSRLTIQAALATEDPAVLRDLLQASLREILYHCKKAQTPTNEVRQRWLHIIDWLDDHFFEDIDRNSVAKLFQLHPNHLSRLFRQQGNESFNAYLIRKRIEHATHLLKNSNLPIAEIGMRCGYPSPSAFSAIIRKITGKAPSALR